MELVLYRFTKYRRQNVLLGCCCSIHRTIDDSYGRRLYSSRFNPAEYAKYYSVLDVKVGSDQETVRQAFLRLVKRFHPDSGSEEADAQRFSEIEKAYRKLQQKFHAERWTDRWSEDAGEYGLYYKEKPKHEETPVVEHDIKHTAPQHRQYLSYDGFGAGTPSQRHKQYQKLRASTAIENVYNHRITKIQDAQTLNNEQSLVVKDKQRAKNIKTRYGMDRLVEDLIQESMARGEFDNLSGKGKPLSTRQDHYNPYVDLVTHKLNQVMIDNGFMPEWITLQKEIREDVEQLRVRLAERWDKISRREQSVDGSLSWDTAIDQLRDDARRVNSKIAKFNLVVPLLPNQMLLFDLEKEAQKISTERRIEHQTTREKEDETKSVKDDETFIGFITSIFSR